jgi:hypothetical protein
VPNIDVRFLKSNRKCDGDGNLGDMNQPLNPSASAATDRSGYLNPDTTVGQISSEISAKRFGKLNFHRQERQTFHRPQN